MYMVSEYGVHGLTPFHFIDMRKLFICLLLFVVKWSFFWLW